MGVAGPSQNPLALLKWTVGKVVPQYTNYFAAEASLAPLSWALESDRAAKAGGLLQRISRLRVLHWSE
jgi:hypothetical protein